MSARAFLILSSICVAVLGACRSAPPTMAPMLPLEPGVAACSATIRTDEGTGVIRVVTDQNTRRQIVDLDGDGNPEEQQLMRLDDQGRIATVEHRSIGGVVLSSERRTWDGMRLTKREIDHRDERGRPGVDGDPDEVHLLVWQDGQLVREEIDQLDEQGLLGVDGEPELVTTWTMEGGRRAVGTRVDTRDQAVLRVDRLTWSGDRIARRTVDLGGDGAIDTTVVNVYERDRLVGQRVDGRIESAEIDYRYCD